MSKGCIYILTNPSFPEFVKIGYAANVQTRVAELNNSTAVPYAFRVYATYEVDSSLSDKKLHSILDRLNPDLRSVEEINGKRRVREFYAMPPEDAYSILEAIAEINNYGDRLKKWEASAEEKQDEEEAEEIREEHKEKRSPFTFTACQIDVGEQIEFWETAKAPSGLFATVYDEKHVEYEGKIYSLTALARELLQQPRSLAGPMYFKYKGEWLNNIRRRLGV